MAQDLGNDNSTTEKNDAETTDMGASRILSRKDSHGIGQAIIKSSDEGSHTLNYNLLKCFVIIVKERRDCWMNLFIIAIACVVGGLTYPALAILISRLITTFQLQGSDLTNRGNFYALMLLIVAIINGVLYFVAGYVSNLVVQVSNSASSLVCCEDLQTHLR
jgi:ATP-binding cassette subfamily B (MDR/TAP) protein 1